jgi:hypothetical protein
VRAVEILCRTSHIGAMAILLGGHHFAVAHGSLLPWKILTAVTGAVLLVTEVRHSRHWVYQGRGIVTMLHVGVLALLAFPGIAQPAMVTALVIGSIGSHLPRSVRKWSLRHRRVVDD